MKFFDKISKKFVKNASTTVKSEVKKTVIDLLPALFGVVSMIAGIVIFKEVVEEPEEIIPNVTTTNITTNNYFFRELTEESIKKIMEEK